MDDTPPSLETIADWLDEHYNDFLVTYIYDDHVRLTNGSAGYYVDIYVANGTTFTLEGERYGETINKSCDADKDSLLTELSTTL